eukprot:CAMPEP_0115422352 /NCGR_PEP_ID=MMETSP0271-20121206/26727_1 /TAXON_ID=71861 /ORGANISM="Scrippsiella trochoidea, Strain CCMP3099" /LENGTH=47 /DNA_ID= /DNA_START= /DNA_END= /DNA_ORIENTATION=
MSKEKSKERAALSATGRALSVHACGSQVFYVSDGIMDLAIMARRAST